MRTKGATVALGRARHDTMVLRYHERETTMRLATHHSAPRLQLGTGLLLAAAALLTTACGPSFDWRKQTVSLQAAGYQFEGTGIKPVGWSGSGVFIDEKTVLTNAHVAGKALKMIGQDDYGHKYTFRQILAYDGDLDIAVLKISGTADVAELPLKERPGDPKELRGTKVLAIGNTGGMGLSRYTGEVTNVVGNRGRENVVHSADISSGSSGGPLYDEDAGDLLGINKSINLHLRQSFATPAWLVERVVKRARRSSGTDLTEAFKPRDFPMQLDVKRSFCLEPGQKIIAPVQVVGTADLVAAVKFQTENTPLFFGLIRGNALMSKGVISKDLLAAWTLPGSGVYAAVLVNPPQAQAKACGAIGVGRMAWEKRIQ